MNDSLTEKNYAMRYQSKHYPRSWHGLVPKAVRMRRRVRSDLPAFLPGGNLVCQPNQIYPVVTNSHGAVSAYIGPGENDFLGLKPDEFEVIEWCAPLECEREGGTP